MRGVDTELVKRAQHGDREAFRLLAADLATRFLAVGRRARQWSPNLRILPADEPVASDRLDAILQRDQLETAIRRLSVDHRTVLVLHHYADIPLDRVAQILEIPVGTVYSRLHHAMRAMRAALDADARPARAEGSS